MSLHKILSALHTFFVVLICLVIWTIVLPFCAPILLILYATRKLIDLIVLSQHPNWRPVAPLDAVHASVKDTNFTTQADRSFVKIGVVITIDGNPSVEEIQNLFETKLLNARSPSGDWKYWKLRCVPTKRFGFYFWAPVLTDVRDHVREGGRKKWKDVNAVVNQWLPASFEGRSPWGVLLYRTEQKKTILFIKWNHIIGDGLALRHVLLNLCDLDKDAHAYPPVVPMDVLSAVFYTITAPRALFHLLLLGYNTECDVPCHNGRSVNIWDAVSLDLIKAIRRKFNISFREVLFVALGSAIRKYLSESKMASGGHLAGIVNPYWPHSPRPENPLANHSTCSFAYFPKQENDTQKMVSKVHAELVDKLQIGVHKMIYAGSSLVYMIPRIAAPISRNKISTVFGVTEVPMVDEMCLMGKYRVTGLYACLSLGGVPLAITSFFVTIGPNVHVSLVGNTSVVPDVASIERIRDYFKAELQVLSQFNNVDQSLEALIQQV